MYELGLRHTRHLLTVQLGEEGRLPFDISVIRTVLFARTEYGLIDARNRLTGILKTGLSGSWDPVTPTRVWNELQTSMAAPQLGDQPIDSAEPGFLEVFAAAENSLPRMAVELQAIGELVGEMGKAAEAGTPLMERAPTSGAKLLVANQFADALEPLAENLEARVGSYADSIKQTGPAISLLLDRIELGNLSDEEAEAAVTFLTNLITTGDISKTSTASVSDFAQTVGSLGAASRKLRQPTDRISRALRRMVDATGTVVAWADRARASQPSQR
jgi:hypothetical protein